MPSKIQLDENLWFLYICLQKSDLKSIDFTAVGARTNLKPPAARMRYTRLRRQIESGTLIGTHGTPFSSTPKRKWGGKNDGFGAGSEGDDEDEDEGKFGSAVRCEAEAVKNVKDGKSEEKEGVVKVNNGSESGFDSSENSISDDEDSEDEIPLAKLRKVHVGPTHPSTPSHERIPFAAPQLAPLLRGIPRGRGQAMNAGFPAPISRIPRLFPTHQGRTMAGFPHTATSFRTSETVNGVGYVGAGWNGGMDWRRAPFVMSSSEPRLSV